MKLTIFVENCDAFYLGLLMNRKSKRTFIWKRQTSVML